MDTVTRKRFYSPYVIACCSAVGAAPVGLFLYGVNVQNRGERLDGIVLKNVAALALFILSLALIVGVPINFVLFGTIAGCGFFALERKSYKQALEQGAKSARWWPPLIFIFIWGMAVGGYIMYEQLNATM